MSLTLRFTFILLLIFSFINYNSTIHCVESEHKDHFRRLLKTESTRAKANTFPYLVVISNRDPLFIICHGSIISVNYILTAAQCLFEGTHIESRVRHTDTIEVISFTDLERDIVHYRSNNVLEYILHPNYTPYDYEVIDYDIALMKLTIPFMWDDGIKPVPIKSINTGFNSLLITMPRIIMYFNIYESPVYRTYYILLKVLPYEDCEKYWPSHLKKQTFSSTTVCANLKPSEHKKICVTDIGAPVVYEEKVIGIVTWAILSCIYKEPTVFTLLTEYDINWMSTITRNFSKNN